MTRVREAGVGARCLGGLTTCVLVASAAVVQAQAPGTGGRTSGLLPMRDAPSVSGGMGREELLRRFDLDSNGRIDEAEAEAARARMRRERVDSMRNSGLDPLTGRPRGAVPAGLPRDEPPARDDELILPGAPDNPPPRKPAEDAEKKPVPAPAPAVPPGRAPPLTGGVRAGAPAVRQGYGATLPEADLNAGRPRDPQPLSNGTRGRPGVQPSGRPGTAVPAPRSPAPRPSLFPQGSSQPTAEDFGR